MHVCCISMCIRHCNIKGRLKSKKKIKMSKKNNFKKGIRKRQREKKTGRDSLCPERGSMTGYMCGYITLHLLILKQNVTLSKSFTYIFLFYFDFLPLVVYAIPYVSCPHIPLDEEKIYSTEIIFFFFVFI